MKWYSELAHAEGGFKTVLGDTEEEVRAGVARVGKRFPKAYLYASVPNRAVRVEGKLGLQLLGRS